MKQKFSAPDPEEEIVDPEKEKTALQQLEEETEQQIFDDDDFIGPAEEED